MGTTLEGWRRGWGLMGLEGRTCWFESRGFLFRNGILFPPSMLVSIQGAPGRRGREEIVFLQRSIFILHTSALRWAQASRVAFLCGSKELRSKCSFCLLPWRKPFFLVRMPTDPLLHSSSLGKPSSHFEIDSRLRLTTSPSRPSSPSPPSTPHLAHRLPSPSYFSTHPVHYTHLPN